MKESRTSRAVSEATRETLRRIHIPEHLKRKDMKNEKTLRQECTEYHSINGEWPTIINDHGDTEQVYGVNERVCLSGVYDIDYCDEQFWQIHTAPETLTLGEAIAEIEAWRDGPIATDRAIGFDDCLAILARVKIPNVDKAVEKLDWRIGLQNNTGFLNSWNCVNQIKTDWIEIRNLLTEKS